MDSNRIQRLFRSLHSHPSLSLAPDAVLLLLEWHNHMLTAITRACKRVLSHENRRQATPVVVKRALLLLFGRETPELLELSSGEIDRRTACFALSKEQPEEKVDAETVRRETEMVGLTLSVEEARAALLKACPNATWAAGIAVCATLEHLLGEAMDAGVSFCSSSSSSSSSSSVSYSTSEVTAGNIRRGVLADRELGRLFVDRFGLLEAATRRHSNKKQNKSKNSRN
jgi:hypothetical protein